MDCLDCHEPGGPRVRAPERALDRALAAGRLAEPPFVKREALRLVKADTPIDDRAGQAIDSELTAFYRDKYPDVFKTKQADVRKAIDSVRQVYASDIFAAMKVGWSTYPDNVGTRSPGAFRCHDGTTPRRTARVIRRTATAVTTSWPWKRPVRDPQGPGPGGAVGKESPSRRRLSAALEGEDGRGLEDRREVLAFRNRHRRPGRDERLNHFGVELRARCTRHSSEIGVRARLCRTVGARGRHGVEGVGDMDDPAPASAWRGRAALAGSRGHRGARDATRRSECAR